jgi:ATP phosphoribosyltransferase regulatory subunit
LYQTPRGCYDVLPAEALVREQLVATVNATFSKAGYVPVETPLLEQVDVLKAAGRVHGAPFQFFDSDERLLMLRPEMTLPIARMASTRFTSDDLPLRLRYVAPVVRDTQAALGRSRQQTQLGIELIGCGAQAAELEVLAVLTQALAALGVEHYTLALGSVRPFAALLAASGLAQAHKEALLALVHASNLVGVDTLTAQLVAAGELAPACGEALAGLVRTSGGAEALDAAAALCARAGVDAAASGLEELRALVAALPAAARERVFIDFSIMQSFDYYTGLIFKVYAAGVGAPLASGGRYDAVLSNLGLSQVGAAGFAFTLERLQAVVPQVAPAQGAALDSKCGEAGACAASAAEKCGEVAPSRSFSAGAGARAGVVAGEEAARPLTIAVPKGSLFAPTLELLEAAGLPTDVLKSPGRRLIIDAGTVRYVIVRASDAPMFVAQGGADCGLCGADSLFEANLSLVELADVGYGACHFVVAEPAAAAGAAQERLARRGVLTIATKYPRIASTYFERKGVPVDLVTLHGNIELGPLVGMADQIVDIVATGTTLRENNLIVVASDVMDVSARLFAGPAALRSNPELRALCARLSEAAARLQASAAGTAGAASGAAAGAGSGTNSQVTAGKE